MNNNHQRQKINTNRLNMSDLVYDIETKISLLSQIEQTANLEKSIIIKNHKNQHEEQQLSQINFPMQMLNTRMMNILNKKQEHNNERTYDRVDKKRMDLHQLQTGTRNVDELKREGKSGIELRHFYNSNHNPNQSQQVKQFNIHNTSQLYNNNISSSPVQSAVLMSNSLSSNSSSKIVNKFNTIQLNYVDKIKTLSFKVTYLQQKLQQSQQQKRDIMQSLETYKVLYTRKQEEINKQIEEKLQQIKSTLIDKFADQCRMKYNEYIHELKQITNLLNDERNKRKLYENQNKVLKLQKENYQQMYKSLLKKQKEYLKIDIDKTKHQLNLSAQNYPQTCDYSHIQNKNCTTDTLIFGKDSFLEDKIKNSRQNKIITAVGEKERGQKSNSKSKNKSLSKTKSLSQKEQRKSKGKQSKLKTSTDQKKSLEQSSVNNKKRSQKSKSNPQQHIIGQKMTKQELIPFLAKGIQQLKQRLKMN